MNENILKKIEQLIKKNKIDLSFPKINYNIILKSPEFLQNNQLEFSKTGGIHASALIDSKGEVIAKANPNQSELIFDTKKESKVIDWTL